MRQNASRCCGGVVSIPGAIVVMVVPKQHIWHHLGSFSSSLALVVPVVHGGGLKRVVIVIVAC